MAIHDKCTAVSVSVHGAACCEHAIPIGGEAREREGGGASAVTPEPLISSVAMDVPLRR